MSLKSPGRSAVDTSQRGSRVVGLAIATTVSAIPIHLYWALGGTWGLPSPAVADLPGLGPTNAIVTAVLTAGAALLAALATPWARRVPAAAVLTPIWLGSVVCISHGLYGMATKALYVAGAHSAVSYPEPLTASQKSLAAFHDLSLFEPWFLSQGLLLLLAGRWFAHARSRRRWTLSILVATVLVDVFGVALSITHRRFSLN